MTVPALPTPTIPKETPKLDTKDKDETSPTASQKWARNTIEDLRDRVYRKYGQLQRAFVDLDRDRNARISNAELRRALEKLNLGHNVGPEQINALLEHCGVSKQSRITFDEFAKALIEPPVMRNSDPTERSEYETAGDHPRAVTIGRAFLPGSNEPEPRLESRRHFDPPTRKPEPRPDERKHFRHVAKNQNESDVPSCLPGADVSIPAKMKRFSEHTVNDV